MCAWVNEVVVSVMLVGAWVGDGSNYQAGWWALGPVLVAMWWRRGCMWWWADSGGKKKCKEEKKKESRRAMGLVMGTRLSELTVYNIC